MGQDGEASVEEILESIKKVMDRDRREGSSSTGGGNGAPVTFDKRTRTSDQPFAGSATASDERRSAPNDAFREEEEPADPTSADEAEEILDLAEMELGDERAAQISPGPAREPASEPAPHPSHTPVSSDSPLVTEAVRGAMQQNLEALAMLSEPGAKPQIVRSGETSLEGLTRELLRPMLAQWLDANLPNMVETMVQAEIARIARKRT